MKLSKLYGLVSDAVVNNFVDVKLKNILVECAIMRDRTISDENDVEIQLIPHITLMNLLYETTYDLLGKMLRKSDGMQVFDEYAATCRSYLGNGLTNSQLMDAYDYLADLWYDNEKNRANKEDGTFDNGTSPLEAAINELASNHSSGSLMAAYIKRELEGRGVKCDACMASDVSLRLMNYADTKIEEIADENGWFEEEEEK